jgi:hypothetical protein
MKTFATRSAYQILSIIIVIIDFSIKYLVSKLTTQKSQQAENLLVTEELY